MQKKGKCAIISVTMFESYKRHAMQIAEMSFFGVTPPADLPLTGFVPNIAEPRRQKYWSE